jgi:hypothetical protein
VALSDDVSRIADAAAHHAASGEVLAAVIAVEPASGERLYVCAYETPDGTTAWLVFDDAGEPVTERQLIRDAASIAALVEVAEETADAAAAEDARLASPAYLDSLSVDGDVAGALQGALPAIEELTRDVELNYKLALE